MIDRATEMQLRELVRREMDARTRSPVFNSQVSPRGITQGRVSKRLVTSLPRVAQEFDEVNLEQSDGSVIPFLFKDGAWTPIGGNYVVFNGLYIPKGDFQKVTVAISTTGALPHDSGFTKEFDDTILEVFMAGSGYRSTAGVIGMFLEIGGDAVADVATMTNETFSHKAFVPRTLTFPSTELGTAGYAAGTYDLDLVVYDVNTLSDANDWFYVTITEKFAETN